MNQFTCYSRMPSSLEDGGEKQGSARGKKRPEGHYTVPFIDYFHCYRQLLLKFTRMLETGEPPLPFDELVRTAKIVIAGDISRREGNRKVLVDELT